MNLRAHGFPVLFIFSVYGFQLGKAVLFALIQVFIFCHGLFFTTQLINLAGQPLVFLLKTAELPHQGQHTFFQLMNIRFRHGRIVAPGYWGVNDPLFP